MSENLNDKKIKFKEFILNLEQEYVLKSDKIDAQQIVNKIVKHYDEIIEKEDKNENK